MVHSLTIPSLFSSQRRFLFLLLCIVSPDGPYSSENCRWSTRHVQNINKRLQRPHHNIYEDNRHGHTLYVVRFEKADETHGKKIIARRSFANIEDAIEYRDKKEVELCLV